MPGSVGAGLVALQHEVFIAYQAGRDEEARTLAEVLQAASRAYVEGRNNVAKAILSARSTPATRIRRARESRPSAVVIDARGAFRARRSLLGRALAAARAVLLAEEHDLGDDLHDSEQLFDAVAELADTDDLPPWAPDEAARGGQERLFA